MIPDLLRNHPGAEVVLLFGIPSADELIYGNEWARLSVECAERFRFAPVCSGVPGPDWGGETGLISLDLIRKYVSQPEEASYFVCGPAAMHKYVLSELGHLNLPPRRIRRENYGCDPRGTVGQSHTVSVQIEGGTEVRIPANGAETVLVALERAGLNPPALCRTGECGWCRGQLIDGSVYIPEESDARRAADRKFGYFHPCASWPESDLVVRIPRNPIPN
jgi:Na+-transporting NADH:ubiquinone oxidoreductase subunit NqrF